MHCWSVGRCSSAAGAVRSDPHWSQIVAFVSFVSQESWSPCNYERFRAKQTVSDLNRFEDAIVISLVRSKRSL